MLKWDKILDLIKLFKPEFYNKITWTVVLAGIALMSSPIWQDALISLINEKFELKLQVEARPDWGFNLVTIGLLYNLLSKTLHNIPQYLSAKHKNEKIREHDTAIFTKLDSIIPETHITGFLDRLLREHAYYNKAGSEIDYFLDEAEKKANSYLDTHLDGSFKNLTQSLDSLMKFLFSNFDMHPPNDVRDNYRICLYPKGNYDLRAYVSTEDSNKYDKLAEELKNCVTQVTECYSTYRTLVKSTLYI